MDLNTEVDEGDQEESSKAIGVRVRLRQVKCNDLPASGGTGKAQGAARRDATSELGRQDSGER